MLERTRRYPHDLPVLNFNIYSSDQDIYGNISEQNKSHPVLINFQQDKAYNQTHHGPLTLHTSSSQMSDILRLLIRASSAGPDSSDPNAGDASAGADAQADDPCGVNPTDNLGLRVRYTSCNA